MRRTVRSLGPAAAAATLGLSLLSNWGATPTRAQPAPTSLTGTWNVDPAHSNVNFAIRHLGISTIRGRFDELAGTIVADAANPDRSSVQVTIQAASIDTDIKLRDDHLRSADFFEVEKYPQITFKSTRVEKGSDGAWVARGPLTMHGVSREITLPCRVAGPAPDPRAGARIGVETQLRLNRQDYGIKYHQVLDNGALALANDVEITISLEAVPARTAASG